MSTLPPAADGEVAVAAQAALLNATAQAQAQAQAVAVAVAAAVASPRTMPRRHAVGLRKCGRVVIQRNCR